MSNRKVVECYYNDINGMVDILSKLANSYRLLIGGAGELNGIALATKGDVKDALKRVNKLGDIIDTIIKEIDECNEEYLEYFKLKSEMIKNSINQEFIKAEILEELKSED